MHALEMQLNCVTQAVACKSLLEELHSLGSFSMEYCSFRAEVLFQHACTLYCNG